MVTFLEQTLDDVTKEEQYLKEMIENVRIAEQDLAKEESLLKTVERIIVRLKEKTNEFAFRKFPHLMTLLSNPQKTYTQEIDDIIKTYAEIKVDITLLNKFIEEIRKRTHEDAWKKMTEESQFLQILSNEHNKTRETVSNFDKAMGWNWAIDVPHFDWNVKERGIEQGMQQVKEKIAEEFKKKYGFTRY
ncbi:MAG: hypothetical protein V1725_02300 [archaeon]